MAGAQNKNSGLEALKPEDTETVKPDDVPAVDENDTVDDASADEVAASEPQPGDSFKKTVAGNTNPDDFSVFDENGNFVEKRER